MPTTAPPSAGGQRDRVGRIQAICERHGVPLAAAALQFPLGHPSVAAVIPGRTLGGAGASATWRSSATTSRPALWAELKHEGLLRQDAPVPA